MKLTQLAQRTWIAALVGVVFGGALLVASNYVGTRWAPVLLTHTGSFVIASVTMAVIFEHWQLRGLLEDLAAKVKGIDELRSAGITGFTLDFHKVPWQDLFQGANRLDLVIAYAQTWRNTNQSALERFVRQKDAVLEVMLPNPDHPTTVAEMAYRFGIEVSELQRRIHEARGFFEDLAADGDAEVNIYYVDRALTFTFYRFNTRAVLTTYRHQLGRGPVLTFLCDRDGPGELYNWLRDEWYGMLGKRGAEPVARQIFSNRYAG